MSKEFYNTLKFSSYQSPIILSNTQKCFNPVNFFNLQNSISMQDFVVDHKNSFISDVGWKIFQETL